MIRDVWLGLSHYRLDTRVNPSQHLCSFANLHAVVAIEYAKTEKPQLNGFLL